MDSYDVEMRDVGEILHEWFPKRRDLCKETMAYIVYAGRMSEDVFKLVVLTNNNLLKYSGSSNLTKEELNKFVAKPLATPLAKEQVVKINVFLTGTDTYVPWLEIRYNKTNTDLQPNNKARLTVHSSRRFLSGTVISTFIGNNIWQSNEPEDTLESVPIIYKGPNRASLRQYNGRVVSRDGSECHLCIAGQMILATTIIANVNCVMYEDGSIVTTKTVQPGEELFLRIMDGGH